MGGDVFDNTISFSTNDYFFFINLLKKSTLKENIDYLFPLRLNNKNYFNDLDLIVHNTDTFIDFFNNENLVKDINIINILKIYNLYSKHILTKTLHQIDLLKSWNNNPKSLKITQIFYSYSIANIFLKKLVNIFNNNLKLSHIGILCFSNKFLIPDSVSFINININTRLIIDPEYLFDIINLDYNTFLKGFNNEFELFNFFQKSKYFYLIKFKYDSSFKRNYNRLKPFKNLVNYRFITPSIY